MDSPTRWQRLEALFERAAALTGRERDALLDRECDDEPALRREVLALLGRDAGAGERVRGAVRAAVESLITRSRIGETIGSYRVLALLGRGGMGEVYLAERADAEFRRRVAIKIVERGAGAAQVAARLRDERQILAGLDHPSIVRMLDGGSTDDGLPYLVMEHVDGTPLGAHVHGLPVRARIELMTRIAEAVQYAHQHLVIHRDLKPSNILVDRDGTPKLLDFGIARLLDAGVAREAETRTGMAMFTPEYASPEQSRGETVTVATDVYSLGAVLYEVLVGRAAHTPLPSDPLELLRTISEVDPPRPSAVAPPALRRALAGDLDNITLRALQKRPDARYPSAAAFADDLRRHLDGLPVLAREATLSYRARKLVRRHRGKLTLACAAALALSASTVVSIREARRADVQAERVLGENRALLVERGWQELHDDHAGRALPLLVEALRAGADSGALRFMLAEAERPFEHVVAELAFPEGLTGIAWSPDGSLALSSFGGAVRIVDRDGATVRTLRADTEALWQPTFSRDGARLGCAGSDGTIRVWRVADGTLIATLVGHQANDWAAAPLAGLAFTSGGDRLVSAGRERRVILWDIATAASIAQLTTDDAISALALSPDDRTVAIGHEHGAIELRDVITGRASATLAGHSALVLDLAYTRDGTRVVSSSVDRTARIWDPSTGVTVAILAGHNGAVGMDLGPDDRTVLTHSDDGTAKVWDLATGSFERELNGHDNGVRNARWSSDGTAIVTTGADDTFRVWNAAAATTDLLIEVTRGGETGKHWVSGGFDARFSPDGSRVALATGGGLTIARVDRDPLVAAFAPGGQPLAAAFTPDERRIAVVGRDVAAILDAGTGARVMTLDVDGAVLWDVGWNPDGTRVVVAGDDGVARILPVSGGEPMLLRGHDGPINRATFSRDGAQVLTAGDDGTARIWDSATAQLVAVFRHPDRVLAAAFSHDDRRIATAGWDGKLRIWDPAAPGVPIATIDGGASQFLDVTWSPDDRRLASSTHAGETIVWDVATGDRIAVLARHAASAPTAAWSPDGALIATAGDDGTVRIWDAASGRQLGLRRHGTNGVMQVSWSRDGTRLLAADANGSVRIWNVPRDQRPLADVAEFTAEHAPYRFVDDRLEPVTPAP